MDSTRNRIIITRSMSRPVENKTGSGKENSLPRTSIRARSTREESVRNIRKLSEQVTESEDHFLREVHRLQANRKHMADSIAEKLEEQLEKRLHDLLNCELDLDGTPLSGDLDFNYSEGPGSSLTNLQKKQQKKTAESAENEVEMDEELEQLQKENDAKVELLRSLML